MGDFTAFCTCPNWNLIWFNTAHGIRFPRSRQLTAACSPECGITSQGRLNGLMKKLLSCCPHKQT